MRMGKPVFLSNMTSFPEVAGKEAYYWVSFEPEVMRRTFENGINHPLALNYVYIRNNKLVGYLFGYLIDDEYHLNKITVKSSHRGKNIGKNLILYCLKKLKYKRVKCILLEVSSLNLIAQKFYKRMNFTYIGSRKDYYSKDENALLYNLRIK